MNHRGPFVLAVCLVVLSSTACTSNIEVEETRPQPTPSSSPSTSAPPAENPPVEEPTLSPPDRKPALEDLVLTTEGFGSLRIGSPVSESDMVVLQANYCADYYNNLPADDPSLSRWIPDYESLGENGDLFRIDVDDEGDVVAIELVSPRFTTDRGIRIGSTVDDLLAAYPEAFDAGVGSLSTVHAVLGEKGVLVVEVARDPVAFGAQQDTVLVMAVGVDRGQTTFVPRAGTDNTIGGCF